MHIAEEWQQLFPSIRLSQKMIFNHSSHIFYRFVLYSIFTLVIIVLPISVSSATEYHQANESKQIEKEVDTIKKNPVSRFREIENEITTLNERVNKYDDKLKEVKNDHSIMRGSNNYISAFATLIATFIGAVLAFHSQKHMRAKEKREKKLTSANLILYILNERLITMIRFKAIFVESIRNNPVQRVQRPPLLNFYIPKSEFDISEISFLLNKKYKDLVIDLYQANEVFHDTVNSIKKRTEVHINEYQASLSSKGYKMREAISEEELKKVIGEGTFEMLDKTSKILINNVDRFLEINHELKPKLLNAFSEMFTKDEILDFNMEDIQIKEYAKISDKMSKN